MYLAEFVVFATCLCLSCHAASELSCSATNTHGNGPITPGSYATLNCSWVGPGADTSDLRWFRIDSGEQMTEMTSQNGVFVWQMAGLNNGVEFLCVGRNITSEMVSTCSLIPLVVPLNVSVQSLGGALILGEEASFICNAEGLPRIAGYRWYVDGLEDDGQWSRFKRLEEGKIVKIDLKKTDNGSVIACEAYVPSGLTANANLTIDLELPSDDDDDNGVGSMFSLWIFIACAAAGGIPVFVLIVVCLAWCLRKTHARSALGSRSKKRSQSRRHIVLNEEIHEPSQPNPEETAFTTTTSTTTAKTTLNERHENGLTGNSWQTVEDEDDGTNPPPHKPDPPPAVDPGSLNLYENTPSPIASAATLPNLGHRPPSSPPHYSAPRPTHQRKKTEYENVARAHDEDNDGDDGVPQDDVYENVAPSHPLSPKPTLGHTASLPNFLA